MRDVEYTVSIDIENVADSLSVADKWELVGVVLADLASSDAASFRGGLRELYSESLDGEMVDIVLEDADDADYIPALVRALVRIVGNSPMFLAHMQDDLMLHFGDKWIPKK